jgi:hypothetical protein
MDLTLVYSKTQKGLGEVKARSGSLSLQARRVLIMVDGKRPVGEIEWVVRGGELENILESLAADGLIEATSTADGVINAAQAAIAAAAEVAEQWQATVPMTPRTPDSIGPRPETLGGVRPGTIRKEPVPASLSEALRKRPATMTGVSPVRPTTIVTTRPATVGGVSGQPAPGARPANGASQAQGGGVAVAVAPVAAPAPAPIMVAAKPATPSLDETKNLAVRELFQRLGPYGEAPAKNIKECTTIDGLREQIKAAGRRVASLRGDKAAQEYLAAVGQI